MKPAHAIVREDTAELDQLGNLCSKALADAEKIIDTGLEKTREAGGYLIKAKEKCKPGTWLKWLASHNINRFKAWRAIQIAEHWSDVARATSQRAAFRKLAEDGEEQEKQHPPKLHEVPAKEPEERCEGGDEEAEAAQAAATKAAKKVQGRPTFDWHEFMVHFNAVVQFNDRLADAQPSFKQSPEYGMWKRLAKSAAELVERLRGKVS